MWNLRVYFHYIRSYNINKDFGEGIQTYCDRHAISSLVRY